VIQNIGGGGAGVPQPKLWLESGPWELPMDRRPCDTAFAGH